MLKMYATEMLPSSLDQTADALYKQPIWLISEQT